MSLMENFAELENTPFLSSYSTLKNLKMSMMPLSSNDIIFTYKKYVP